MPRTYSRAAQLAFNARARLSDATRPTHLPGRIARKLARKLAGPFLNKLAAGHWVDVQAYGQTLRMPAEHHLTLLIQAYPNYNRPLALAVQALAEFTADRPITVIDIGANIGETISIIEQQNPGISTYLCIEADQEIADICRFNHKGNSRVETVQCFIGEQEGAIVQLQDDGRANAATKIVAQQPDTAAGSHNKLLRLDTVAAPFAEKFGTLSLIKVDTEGFDFSVIRSGSLLLERYHPALYFEWYPALLNELGEDVCGGFDFLAKHSYEHFVFFASTGEYYCKLSQPDHFLLRSLAAVAQQNPGLLYFDVFASTSEPLCRNLTERSIRPK
jgi:FkbM family methyltransferase